MRTEIVRQFSRAWRENSPQGCRDNQIGHRVVNHADSGRLCGFWVHKRFVDPSEYEFNKTTIGSWKYKFGKKMSSNQKTFKTKGRPPNEFFTNSSCNGKYLFHNSFSHFGIRTKKWDSEDRTKDKLQLKSMYKQCDMFLRITSGTC